MTDDWGIMTVWKPVQWQLETQWSDSLNSRAIKVCKPGLGKWVGGWRGGGQVWGFSGLEIKAENRILKEPCSFLHSFLLRLSLFQKLLWRLEKRTGFHSPQLKSQRWGFKYLKKTISRNQFSRFNQREISSGFIPQTRVARVAREATSAKYILTFTTCKYP